VYAVYLCDCDLFMSNLWWCQRNEGGNTPGLEDVGHLFDQVGAPRPQSVLPSCVVDGSALCSAPCVSSSVRHCAGLGCGGCGGGCGGQVQPGLWGRLTGPEGVQGWMRARGHEELLTEEDRADANNEYHPYNFQPARMERMLLVLLSAQWATSVPLGWFDTFNPVHCMQVGEASFV
jgi:hypothetical protein